MVSPTLPGRRREAVAHLRRAFPKVSERRACRVVGQPRTTERHRPRKKDDEPAILKRMHELVRERPRFGYRRIHMLLVREGFRLGRHRTHRLWKREGFKVPVKQAKKTRMGDSGGGILRRQTQRLDDVWAWDFIHDRPRKMRTVGRSDG